MAENAPARIERELSKQILRGELAPGSHLPPVRVLAQQYGVNVSTAHRGVARLEKTGLVTVRHGSGMKVNDPHTHADLSLLPVWIEALADDPERVVAMVRDFLELRRALAACLLVRHRQRVLGALGRLSQAAEQLVEARERGIDALRSADMALARTLLKATGNSIAVAFLNTAAQLLAQTPSLAQAMYADPASNLASMHCILQALHSDRAEHDLLAVVETALAEVDRGTITRFGKLLCGDAAAAHSPGLPGSPTDTGGSS